MTTANLKTTCTSATEQAGPLASIIVNNFNYGRYLRQAIDSALNQRYAHTEVIVVDDGSTDESREIIASYGGRIRPVLKANGGQSSALNAGFAASRGEVILFLDADDLLLPNTVANVIPKLLEDGVSKVHWPMLVIDAAGERTGEMRPAHPLSEGDLRQQVLERGPSNVSSAPTSGNAWSRLFLERVMPIPEDSAYYRLCADEYLYTLAPVFGRLRAMLQPQGFYRIHGRNVYSSRSLLDKLRLELNGHAEQCRALSEALSRNDIHVNLESWKDHSWFHRLDQAITDLLAVVPEGAEFVLVDGGAWDFPREFLGRRVRPFLDFDGMDGGPPPDDQGAIDGLTALLEQEVPYLVVAWPCFWWFEEYRRFSAKLHADAHCLVSNEAVEIYQLQPRGARSPIPGLAAAAAAEGAGQDA